MAPTGIEAFGGYTLSSGPSNDRPNDAC